MQINKKEETIGKLLHIFTSKEKRQFLGLGLAILVMGFLEVVGVASILPFMQLIAEPDAISQSSLLSNLYNWFNFSSHRQMLIYMGISIILLIGFTNCFSIFTLWLQYKFSWRTAHSLGIRLLRTYLNKPYQFYLNANTSDLRAYLISEVSTLTGGVLIPLIEVISRGFVSIVIFGLLLKVDIKIALSMFLGLGGAYFLIYMGQKNWIKRLGEHRINMNVLRYQSLQELLDGIKTIFVYNQKSFFFDRYENASREFTNIQPKYQIALGAPKLILEFLAFGSILGITIYLFVSSGSIQSSLPRLSLYAVAGYRLLPALQKAFSSAAKIKHNYPVLDRLYDDLVFSLRTQEDQSFDSTTSLDFEKAITIEHLSFAYQNSQQLVLKDLNVTIEKGATVAFIGSTGSGKTTLVDILVGLLPPASGAVTIDDTILDKTSKNAWREELAYVPQEVFLFDDTVLRNIVIGIPEKEIDHARIEAVTKMADIYNFISQEMPKGFQTEIGEKGVRLSGGQRQRLGLARALYKMPSVLILDEATSALDSITEKGIIESLKKLPRNITTIIIAHRLSTVRHADCIYILDQGKITAQGDYNSLIASNETFKTMVELS